MKPKLTNDLMNAAIVSRYKKKVDAQSGGTKGQRLARQLQARSAVCMYVRVLTSLVLH